MNKTERINNTMKEKRYLAEFRSGKYIFREDITAADNSELQNKISNIGSSLRHEYGRKFECVSTQEIVEVSRDKESHCFI